MISNLEKEITFRYLKTRKKDGFLNVITIFSFIGISLGVAVLIIVMSVMNGFRSDLIKKINGFNSHATIQSYDGEFNLKKLDKSNLRSQIDDVMISNNGEGIIAHSNGAIFIGQFIFSLFSSNLASIMAPTSLETPTP